MVSVPSRGSRLSNKLGGCMEVEIYFGFRPLAGFKVIQPITFKKFDCGICEFPSPREVQGYPTWWSVLLFTVGL